MAYTFNSATKIQSENYRLRKYIEKLESGEAITKLQKEYEKRIRALEYKLHQKDREAEKYHNLWINALKQIDAEKSNTAIISAEKDAVVIERDNLMKELITLQEKIQEFIGIVSKLKAQLNRDYENSAIPSSQKQNHKKIKNSREKTERKPGGQLGHVGHKRPRLTPTLKEEIPVPEEILNNPDYYLTGIVIKKQVVDLEVRVRVMEYSTPEYRNRITGTRGHAPFPKGVVNDVSYGGNVKAFAFLLNNYCNVSIDKTQEMISELTENKIRLSKGMINGLSRIFSAKTVEERKQIFSNLLSSPVMYSDATTSRINGKNAAVIICATPKEMLYFSRERKGHEGLKGTPVEDYQFILVHDHDKTYYNYGSEHQECLSHVLRYLKDSMENEPHLTWNKEMRKFLQTMIHKVKSNREISGDKIIEYERRYDELIKIAESEYKNHPPTKYYCEGYNLFKRMKEYRDNHLLFLHNPEVEYTNNLSERLLRIFKRKMKQAVTFRSSNSVTYLCEALGIIETGHARGDSIYQITKNAFA